MTDIYDYGFDQGLNKTIESSATPLLYDAVGGQVQGQTINVAGFIAGAANTIYNVDPTRGMWMGAQKFEDAPFAVNMQGDMRANSVLITGLSNISKLYTAGSAITANDAVYLDGYQSDGGVTYDTATNGAWSSDGSGNVTIATPLTVGNNSNRILLLVIEVHSADNPDGWTWKWDGVTMTSTDSAAQFPAGGGYLKGYYLVAPNTGAKNITATTAASKSGRYTLYSYYNAKQTGQLDGHGIATGTNTAAVSITPTTVGSLFWGCFIDYDSTSGITSSSGFSNNIQNGSTSVQLKAGDAGNITVLQQQTATVNDSTGTHRVGAIALSIAPFTTAIPAVKRASAAALTTTAAFIGFAATTVTAGSTVLVYISGEVTGFSNLIFGSLYYLANTVGAISTSIGTFTRKAGIATSSTTLLITNIW